MVTVLLW